jgi:ubiquitin C-terminal hydrolase
MGEICNELTGEDELRKFVKKGIEQFYTISLDIKGKKSLVEALQYYIKADVLDGDNMYYSEELNKKVRATKRSYIRKLPNTLVFTLKRF